MNIADHLRLRQREQIAVVHQVLVRVLEPLPADIRLGHPIGTDRRAHRAIDNGDAALQNVVNRVWTGISHRSFIILSANVLNPAIEALKRE